MIRRRVLIFLIFHFYLIVNFTTAYPKIFVVQDPHESRNRYGNILNNISHRDSRNYDDIELITKALEIVKKQKSGLTAVEINKCLYTNFGNTKQKFNCIKKLVYKGKSGNVDSKPYFYTKYFNKRLPDYEHNLDDKFLDLTKSSYDNDGKRSFQNMLKFSQDYLDIHDLLRTETVDFIDDEPTETESKDHVPMFIPIKNDGHLLRDFSRDYLDTQDLFRRSAKVFHEIPNQMINTEENKDSHGLNSIKLNQKPEENKSKKKNVYVFKLIPIKKDARRAIGPQDDFIEKKILRTLSDESDTSDESESESKEKQVNRKKTKRKDKKLKRFQVVDKSAEDTSKEDNTSNENDVPMQRPIEIPKKEKKVLYMQAPNRIFKISKDGRRRLPYFLPKRYHWDEEDMRNLDNYWFNGPQGKYSGHYKTPH